MKEQMRLGELRLGAKICERINIGLDKENPTKGRERR